MLSKKTHLQEVQPVAFMLPHEHIEVLSKLCQCGLYKNVPIRWLLWNYGGVPVNWDRTDSVEVLSLNLPGQCGLYKNLRMPITVLSRKQVTDGTWDDLMTIIAWSLQFAALGQHPRARHNGAPWLPSDYKRAKKVHSLFQELSGGGEG